MQYKEVWNLTSDVPTGHAHRKGKRWKMLRSTAFSVFGKINFKGLNQATEHPDIEIWLVISTCCIHIHTFVVLSFYRELKNPFAFRLRSLTTPHHMAVTVAMLPRWSVFLLFLFVLCSSGAKVVAIDVHAAKRLIQTGSIYLDVR